MKGEDEEHQPIETRFLPKNYNSKVSMSVYGQKVGIIFWLQDPLVIMIKDQKAAKSSLNYFEMVWESAEK